MLVIVGGQPAQAQQARANVICSREIARHELDLILQQRRIQQARTNVSCAREGARHELDLILWQQARREVTAELLGVPVDQVTRRDLLWSNLRFGRPPLAYDAPRPRRRRAAQSPPP